MEKTVQTLQKQQNEILRKLEFLYEDLEVSFYPEVKRKLGEDDIIARINKLLVEMFNKNRIDLAEGGEPKYPLIYQNRIFGMVAIQ